MSSFSEVNFNNHDNHFSKTIAQSRLCNEKLSPKSAQAFNPFECEVSLGDRIARTFSNLSPQELTEKCDILNKIKTTYYGDFDKNQKKFFDENLETLERLKQASQSVVPFSHSSTQPSSHKQQAELVQLRSELARVRKERAEWNIWNFDMNGLREPEAIKLEISLLNKKSVQITNEGTVLYPPFDANTSCFCRIGPYDVGYQVWFPIHPENYVELLVNDVYVRDKCLNQRFELEHGLNEFYVRGELFLSINIVSSYLGDMKPTAAPAGVSKETPILEKDVSEAVQFLRSHGAPDAKAGNPRSLLNLPAAERNEGKIKKAYLNTCRVTHPDKNRSNEKAATAAFNLATQAYQQILEEIRKPHS